MGDWNPGQYLKFESDRNKPVIDLLRHINPISPARIVDIGCGPGNSTRFLAQRWPDAEIIGLDRSKTMLQTAKETLPGLQWIEYDAMRDLSPLGTFDLVFSNAALQWMPDHERVISNFFELLNPGGVLAVQLPHNYGSPLHRALQELAESEVWRGRLPQSRALNYFPAGFYYDILSRLTGEFEVWATTYYHVLNAQEDIIEWYKGTGFRPYLDQLGTPGQQEFLAGMLSQIQQLYAPQADGKILFDFKRLFFTASR